MNTVKEPPGVEEPKLCLNRPLVQIDEYASRIGVTRGVIEQAAKLGIIRTRKFRGQTFVLDIPIPEVAQLEEVRSSDSEDLQCVVSRLLSEIEKKQKTASQYNDNFAGNGQGSSEVNIEKNRGKIFTGIYTIVKKLIGKLSFEIDFKGIFRRKFGSRLSKPADDETGLEFPGYPNKNRIRDLQKLRVHDLLVNSPVFKAVKSVAVYGLLVVLVLGLLANLWVYTYSDTTQPAQSGDISTASVNVNQLQSQYSKAQQRINLLEEQLAETQARNEQLESRVGSLQNRINTLNAELSITRSSLKQLRFQNRKALQQLEGN